MSNKLLAIILIPLFIVVFLISFFIMKHNIDIEDNKNEENDKQKEVEKTTEENDKQKEVEKMTEETKEIVIEINGSELIVKLENNSSSEALYNKILEDEIVVAAHDYGSFEKVGELGFTLPTNDQRITTKPGDLILYQGNQITVYYDENTWSFTKLGHLNGTEDEIREAFGGKEDVTAEFAVYVPGGGKGEESSQDQSGTSAYIPPLPPAKTQVVNTADHTNIPYWTTMFAVSLLFTALSWTVLRKAGR